MYNQIPDYSRKSISEALDAAILRAAFLELEEEAMKQLYDTARHERKLHPDRAGFARKLRARAARQRLRGLVSCGLPRAMRAAACLIGVLALGAGVALAASAAAREWAAGVLTTGVEKYAQSDSWEEGMPTLYVGNHAAGGYSSGAAVGDTLWLLGNINNENVLFAQTSTESEPRVYPLQDAQNRHLYFLTAGDGDLYGLYLTGAESDKPCFGVGRICLGEGSYTLETVLELDCEQFAPPEGCAQKSLYVQQLLWGNGKLYLALNWEDAQGWTGRGSGWGDGGIGLYCVDAAGGAMEPIALPELDWNGMTCTMELFSGADGAPCLALTTAEWDAVGLWAIQADGSLSPLAEIPGGTDVSASCFACSAEGTLYYLQNGLIYAVPGFDVASAQRVAAVADSGIQGVALGSGGYVLVNTMRAQVFPQEQAEEIGELKVYGAENMFAVERFMQEHPDVAIVQSGEMAEYDGDIEAILASGALESDVYILDQREIQYLLDAGLYTPLEDAGLLEAVSRMNTGIQDFVTRDAQVVAFPLRGIPWCDLVFYQSGLEALGLSMDAIPETWDALLDMLAQLSRGALAQAFTLPWDDAEAFACNLLDQMAAGYERRCAAEGQAADFAGAEFAQLLQRLGAIDFHAFAYAAAGGGAQSPELLSQGGMYWLADAANTGRAPVSLKFAPEEEVYSRASGYFAVINPASKQRKLAQQYVRCYLDTAEDEESLVGLYAQADLGKLAYSVSEQDYQRYRNAVGELRIPNAAHGNSDALRAQLDSLVGAWLAGQGGLEAVGQTLNAFYAAGA